MLIRTTPDPLSCPSNLTVGARSRRLQQESRLDTQACKVFERVTGFNLVAAVKRGFELRELEPLRAIDSASHPGLSGRYGRLVLKFDG
jgi:hypothetical protein